MDLRERVEDGAGCLVELNRAADIERAMQRIFGARKVAQPDANLTERRKRDGQPVARAVRFVERHAPLGESERLLVAVLHHRHVRLVAADKRQHIVGVNGRGETFRLTQCAHRLVVAAHLRKRDARQRVHEREVPAVAGRVQRGRRLRDVLPDDGDVADLAIALAELVVREADAARIVRGLGLLQRAAVHRDRARLIAARRREPAVQPPQRRQVPRRNRVAKRIGRPSERARGLIEIVLQQRRFGEHRANRQLLVARKRRRPQRGREHLNGVVASSPFERRSRAHKQGLQG